MIEAAYFVFVGFASVFARLCSVRTCQQMSVCGKLVRGCSECTLSCTGSACHLGDALLRCGCSLVCNWRLCRWALAHPGLVEQVQPCDCRSAVLLKV